MCVGYTKVHGLINREEGMDSEGLIVSFRRKLEVQRFAPNTVKSYVDYARIFLTYMHRYQSLQSIPIDEIEAFINHKVLVEKISSSYQKGLVGAIQKLYLFEVGHKLPINYLYPSRKENKLPSFFSKEEVKRILDGTTNTKHKAILMTIYSCGLRVSELVQLRIEDVRSADNLIVIRQSKGNKDRMVTLSERLLHVLRNYYVEYKPKEYLFEGEKGGMYSVRSVQLVLKKAMQLANVKTKGSVHTLRHSFATHLIEAGTDIRIVQELMGHNSVKTTMIYTHITDQLKRKTPSPLDFL